MYPIYFVYSGQRELTSLKRETGGFLLHFCMVPTIMVESWSCRSKEWWLLSPSPITFWPCSSSLWELHGLLQTSSFLFSYHLSYCFCPPQSCLGALCHPIASLSHLLLLKGIKTFLQDKLKPHMLQPGLCSVCRGAHPKAVPLPHLLPSPPSSCLPSTLTGSAGEWRRGNVIFFPCIQWKEAL